MSRNQLRHSNPNPNLKIDTDVTEVHDAIARGTRVLVLKQGPVDINTATSETFVCAVSNAPGMCMVESDTGMLRSVPIERVVCKPFRELHAKLTLSAVRACVRTAAFCLRAVNVMLCLGNHSEVAHCLVL